MGYGVDYGGSFVNGIYQCTSGGANHVVVIAGYNDTGNYWIIKNSYGTGWQDSGYFKVAYDN